MAATTMATAAGPATWFETISTLSERLRFTYSETLGKWPIGDLAFGINYLLRSVEEAQAAHLYSYKHGFKGFAAKLTEAQALQIAKMEGVVSMFENTKRTLHTTHSSDFIGLAEQETMEIPGFSTKNQVNVIIGFKIFMVLFVMNGLNATFHTVKGIWPESSSFSDAGMPRVPAGWKGMERNMPSGEAFNASNCNRKVIGAVELE